MNIDDTTTPLIGEWTFTAYYGDKILDALGNVLNRVAWQLSATNIIVTSGKQLMLDRLFNLGGAVPISGLAVGTNSGAASLADTIITNPAYKAFASTPTRSGQVVTAVTSYTTAEANINIQEAGLMTASGGILFNRLAPIGPFNKTSAVALDVTVQITQS